MQSPILSLEPARYRVIIVSGIEEPQIKSILLSSNIQHHFQANPAELLKNLPNFELGCVLLDSRLPLCSSTDIIQQIKKRDPTLPIIYIGNAQDIEIAIKAFKEGISDFLLKPLNERKLLETLVLACRKRQKEQHQQSTLQEINKNLSALSKREHEALQYVLEGLPNKAIAVSMGISTKTVELHRANIMKKMQVNSLAELIRKITHLQLKEN